jgi:hypothetical protein
MPDRDRRAAEPLILPVYLTDHRSTEETADGEVVGFGFTPYLDEGCTEELVEDDRSPVLPGVFYTPVAGVSFHDDVLQRPDFGAGREVEIRHEPANSRDRSPLAVFSGECRVGYLPEPVATALAPSGTRRGHAIIVREWSTNGVRQAISVLGSMHVSLAVTHPDGPGT